VRGVGEAMLRSLTRTEAVRRGAGRSRNGLGTLTVVRTAMAKWTVSDGLHNVSDAQTNHEVEVAQNYVESSIITFLQSCLVHCLALT